MGNNEIVQYISLESLSSKGYLHSDKIQLTTMGNAYQDHDRASAKRNCFWDVPGSKRRTALPPNTCTIICPIKKKPAVFRPIDFSA